LKCFCSINEKSSAITRDLGLSGPIEGVWMVKCQTTLGTRKVLSFLNTRFPLSSSFNMFEELAEPGNEEGIHFNII